MVDSTNPRVMADNIKKLAQASGSGAAVVANPEGGATDSLNKLGIGEEIYSIPIYAPPAYSTTKFDTGKKYNGKTVYGQILTGAFGSGTDEVNVFTLPSGIENILFFNWSATKGTTTFLPGSQYVTVRIDSGYFKVKLSSATPQSATAFGYIEFTETTT